MKIKSISSFKDQSLAATFFADWVKKVSTLSGTEYTRLNVNTALGNTVVWAINYDRTDMETIVIFPGFRTCSLFWDLDNALEPLKKNYRIFLVDTNGQPCLSDGKTPDIKSDGYGVWAVELFENLSIKNAVIAGASFGGLVCLKLCLTASHLVKKVILMNPGCLQPFSLSLKNLYYNFLPLVSPNEPNIKKFLDNAVFFKSNHAVSAAAKKLIIDYELFAITQFRDKTQKPYAMSKNDLAIVKPDVYLILGDKDVLFPYKKSLTTAKKYMPALKGFFILPDTGHGIETSKEAIKVLCGIAQMSSNDETYNSER